MVDSASSVRVKVIRIAAKAGVLNMVKNVKVKQDDRSY